MSSKSKSTPRRLYDAIVNLRAGAAMIFDKGIAKDLPKEEIAKSIEPIQRQYDEIVGLSAKDHPAEIALTITILENNAGSLLQSSHWLKQKADQELDYALKLRKVMTEEMKSRGLTHLEVAGFLFTISADGLGIEVR